MVRKISMTSSSFTPLLLPLFSRSTRSKTREPRNGSKPLPTILVHSQKRMVFVTLRALTRFSSAASMSSVMPVVCFFKRDMSRSQWFGGIPKSMWAQMAVQSFVMRLRRRALHMARFSRSGRRENSRTFAMRSSGSCSILLRAEALF